MFENVVCKMAIIWTYQNTQSNYFLGTLVAKVRVSKQGILSLFILQSKYIDVLYILDILSYLDKILVIHVC